MSDIKNEFLAAIIREQLTKEKGKITAEYLKNKLSSTDSSLRYGDFIALSYIINEALKQEPTLIQNLDNLNNLNNLNKLDKLEDFISHHDEIQQILGHESPGIPSSGANTNPAGPTEKKQKREKKKIAETQIILNKMIDHKGNAYGQAINSRNL